MKHRSVLSCRFLVAVTAIGVFGLAQDSPTEAPAGFDTPTLAQNPGSRSKSNGITEPVQGGPADTRNKLRTAPLWGLRMRPRFMHDLRSLSLESAIERHKGEARQVEERFEELSAVEKQQLFVFLNSL
jgi:Di-haem oxidoreductase, putative peroxidase